MPPKKARKTKPQQMGLPLPADVKPIQEAVFTVIIESATGYRKHLDATPEALQPLIQRGWKVVQWLNEVNQS